MGYSDLHIDIEQPLTIAFAGETMAALRSSLQDGRHASLTLKSSQVDLCGLQILLAAARSAVASGGSLSLAAPCHPEMQSRLACSALLDSATAPGPFRFTARDPA